MLNKSQIHKKRALIVLPICLLDLQTEKFLRIKYSYFYCCLTRPTLSNWEARKRRNNICVKLNTHWYCLPWILFFLGSNVLFVASVNNNFSFLQNIFKTSKGSLAHKTLVFSNFELSRNIYISHENHLKQ